MNFGPERKARVTASKSSIGSKAKISQFISSLNLLMNRFVSAIDSLRYDKLFEEKTFLIHFTDISPIRIITFQNKIRKQYFRNFVCRQIFQNKS